MRDRKPTTTSSSSTESREQWAPYILGHRLHTWLCRLCGHIGNCLATAWEIMHTHTHISFMTQQLHSHQKCASTEDTLEHRRHT